MADTILIGIGDSFMYGDEAGGPEKSYLARVANFRSWDWENYGEVGRGNIGIANSLLANAINDYTKYKKRYLIWSPSGINRVDLPSTDSLIKKDYDVWTLFPHPNGGHFGGELVHLNEPCKHLYPLTSRNTQITNFFLAWKMIDVWCKAYDFEYVIFPAFRNDVLKQHLSDYSHTNFYKTLPWENFIEVDGHTNYLYWVHDKAGLDYGTDMLEWQKHRDNQSVGPIKRKLRMQEIEMWVAPRGHATEYATEQFAEVLNKFLPFE